MNEQSPKLEILFDPTDANTHQPAATHDNVLRKFLRVVVHNAGNYVAKNCKARARVILSDADKDNDNKLRYPSTDQKVLAWDSNFEKVDINVDDNEILIIAFADSSYPDNTIQEAPKRFASLGTPRALVDGLRVEDSFHTGDFEIQVSVHSEETSVKATVKIHVDQSTLNTTLTSVSSNQ